MSVAGASKELFIKTRPTRSVAQASTDICDFVLTCYGTSEEFKATNLNHKR